MSTKLVRAGEIAAVTGLPVGFISRLANRKVIPSVRPVPSGNRYFEIRKVMASLGLAMPGADAQEGERNE
jgi:hypothetical protein